MYWRIKILQSSIKPSRCSFRYWLSGPFLQSVDLFLLCSIFLFISSFISLLLSHIKHCTRTTPFLRWLNTQHILTLHITRFIYGTFMSFASTYTEQCWIIVRNCRFLFAFCVNIDKYHIACLGSKIWTFTFLPYLIMACRHKKPDHQ